MIFIKNLFIVLGSNSSTSAPAASLGKNYYQNEYDFYIQPDFYYPAGRFLLKFTSFFCKFNLLICLGVGPHMLTIKKKASFGSLGVLDSLILLTLTISVSINLIINND